MLRDFTAETIEKFITYMDLYFKEGENTINSIWDRILFTLGIYNRSFPAKGDHKKYIRSLASRREAAEDEVIRVWKLVANLEERFSGKFSAASEQLKSYSNMAKQMHGCIGSGQLGGQYDFGALEACLVDDYLATMEARALMILEKDCTQWTDGDLEVLAYVSINSQDETLVLKIVNRFYTEDEKYRDGYDFSVYQRNEEQWNKFVALSNYYYTECYQGYLYGNPPVSDSEFEGVIRKRLIIQKVDEVPTGSWLFAEKGQEPFIINQKGIFSCTYSQDAPGESFMHGPTPVTNDYGGPFPRPMDGTVKIKKECDLNVRFADGKNAQTAFTIDGEVTAVAVQDSWVNEKSVAKVIKKGVKAVANEAVPGSGKVIDTVVNVLEKTEKAATPASIKEYKETFDVQYAALFRMKVAKTADGYMALPTPATRERVDHVMNWLEQHKTEYPDIYASYYPKAGPYKGIGKADDPLNFYTSLNTSNFIKNLYSAGILDLVFPDA